jgi:hypothetical protein
MQIDKYYFFSSGLHTIIMTFSWEYRRVNTFVSLALSPPSCAVFILNDWIRDTTFSSSIRSSKILVFQSHPGGTDVLDI